MGGRGPRPPKVGEQNTLEILIQEQVYERIHGGRRVADPRGEIKQIVQQELVHLLLRAADSIFSIFLNRRHGQVCIGRGVSRQNQLE